MSRYKDANWTLPAPKLETWEQAGLAVLMDIRDELKQLNRVFSCGGYAGGKLDAIRYAVERLNKPRRITAKQAARVMAKRRNRKRRPGERREG